MGIFIGMILGAIIVTIAVAAFNQNDNPFSQTSSTKQAEASADTQQTPAQVASLPGKPGDRPAEKPDFTFFNTLPTGENAPVAPPTPTEQKQAPPQPQPQTATPPASLERQTYLQLAAFENAEQADDLKARLLLMGLDPITQRAQLPDKRIVHRIRVGPFTNREDLKAMRDRLVSSGFSAEEISN